MSDSAANALAGNIPLSIAIKGTTEVRKALEEGWYADQVKAIHDKKYSRKACALEQQQKRALDV